MHHPWRTFRHLVGWTLHWTDLPDGTLAKTDFRARTVTLTTGLTQAERRCTIAHENEHIARGPAPASYEHRDELEVRKATARRMIPLPALVEAMLWSLDDHEIAHELWVDVATVQDRLHFLTAEESLELNRRLDSAELRIP